jgi:hypothetical protein
MFNDLAVVDCGCLRIFGLFSGLVQIFRQEADPSYLLELQVPKGMAVHSFFIRDGRSIPIGYEKPLAKVLDAVKTGAYKTTP